MILRMMPEAFSRQWDNLKLHIAKSLPKDECSEQTLTNILEGVLKNQIMCWISYDSQNDNQVNFVFLLEPLNDPFKQERNLLVYTITRMEKLDQPTTIRMYQEGYVALQKFMKKAGYSKLVGYIDEDNYGLVKRAKEFGSKLRWHWALNMEG